MSGLALDRRKEEGGSWAQASALRRVSQILWVCPKVSWIMRDIDGRLGGMWWPTPFQLLKTDQREPSCPLHPLSHMSGHLTRSHQRLLPCLKFTSWPSSSLHPSLLARCWITSLWGSQWGISHFAGVDWMTELPPPFSRRDGGPPFHKK